MRLFLLAVFSPLIFNHVGATVQEIEVSELKFMPAVVDINQGDMVRWINRDVVDHKIQGSFGVSSNLSPNQTYEFVFNQAGNFDYISALHSGVTGTIRVVSVTQLPANENSGALNFSDLFGTGDNFEPEDLAQTASLPQIETLPQAEIPNITPFAVTQITPPLVNTRTITSAPPVRAEARATSSNQSLPTAGAGDFWTYLLVLSVIGGLFYVFGFNRR